MRDGAPATKKSDVFSYAMIVFEVERFALDEALQAYVTIK